MKVFRIRKWATLVLWIVFVFALAFLTTSKPVKASGFGPPNPHHKNVLSQTAQLLAKGGRGAVKWVFKTRKGRVRVLMVKRLGDGKWLRVVMEEDAQLTGKWRLVTNYVAWDGGVGGIKNYAIDGRVVKRPPSFRIIKKVPKERVGFGRWFLGTSVTLGTAFVFVPQCSWIAKQSRWKAWVGLPCKSHGKIIKFRGKGIQL